jgi:nucleoside-diphosphate-sugar epimerase
MRIFLAGGTGAIGRPFITQATRRGHQVIATTRSPGKAPLLKGLGATPVVMDGLDASAVGEAVARAKPDAIVHQMTALSGKADFKHFDEWFAETNRLRTDGLRHLLAAAQATGVTLFAAQSYAGWPGSQGPAVISTEEDPLTNHPLASQRESLAAIAYLERTVTSAAPAGIVLRYGSLYGPGASDEMVRMLRKRMMPMIGGGTAVTSWIHVDDAAGATIAALEQPRAGIYNIVDDEPARVSEWLPAMARAVGARAPLSVPSWLGRLLAGEAAVRFMTETGGFSNAKALLAFDWKLQWPSWRDGFRRALTGRDDGRRAA